jgi:hypothetical protein
MTIDGLDVSSSTDEGNRMTCTREHATKKTADCACANYRYILESIFQGEVL